MVVVSSLPETDLSIEIRNEGSSTLSCLFNLFTRGPSAIDWNYTCVSQKGLNNRAMSYSRGFVLGGCTSISEQRLWHSCFLPFLLRTFDKMTWHLHGAQLKIMTAGLMLLKKPADHGSMLKYMFKAKLFTAIKV